jgi:hypothetical protein
LTESYETPAEYQKALEKWGKYVSEYNEKTQGQHPTTVIFYDLTEIVHRHNRKKKQ